MLSLPILESLCSFCLYYSLFFALGGLNVCYNLNGTYTLPPTVAPTTATPPALYGNCGSNLPPTPIAPTFLPEATTIATSDATTTLDITTTTVSPSDTITTTVALPSSTLSSTNAGTTAKGSCELDSNGSFGQEASRAFDVNYFYELVTDPVQGGSIDDIIDVLGRNVLVDLLPSIFPDTCSAEPPGARQLADVAHAAVGARTGLEGPIEGGKNMIVI